MNRKVIQITESGIFLCDDGTMWERFTPAGEIGRGGFRKVTKSKWVQLEDVPQPEESSDLGQPREVKETKNGLPKPHMKRPSAPPAPPTPPKVRAVSDDLGVDNQTSPPGAPPTTEYVKSFKRKSIFSGWFA